MKKNIVLVGFMATGKTSIGKLLSKSLNLDFIDIDTMIEEIEKKTIEKIFDSNGELYFRKKESEALNKLQYSRNKIISTGGGIVISEYNRRKLKNIGKVIYLESSPKWILINLQRSKTVRPLLKNEKKPIDKIKKLLNERKKYYDDVADFKVEVDEKTLDEIVNNIIYNLDL